MIARIVTAILAALVTTADARTYCPPADPEHIPYMRDTYGTTIYRQYCPRTPTEQKPYCPTTSKVIWVPERITQNYAVCAMCHNHTWKGNLA